MTVYEYTTYRSQSLQDWTETAVTATLNRYGADGWELVMMEHGFQMVFRRPRPSMVAQTPAGRRETRRSAT